MATRNRVLFFLSIWLFIPAAFAAKKLDCQMKWERLTEGKLDKKFTLDKEIKLPAFAHEQVVIAGDKNKSQVKIYQYYGEKNESHLRYELQCDSSPLCSGARITSVKGKEKREPFTFAPSPKAIAKIGEREIFHFSGLPSAGANNGFRYHFIEYLAANGKPMGMELDCHE